MRLVLAATFVLTAHLVAQAPTEATAAPKAEAELIARAKAIHQRALTLDTHKDISAQLAPEKLPDDPKTREEFRARNDPTVRGQCQVDFPKMREGGYDCAFFIVFTGQGKLTPDGYHRARVDADAKFDAIHRMVRLHGDIIGLATTPDEVEKIVASGRLCACIGIENGYPMGEDLSAIAQFHARGGRYMGIAHNGHSQLGDSHMPAEPLHGGLSELGKKAIAEMNRVGIMVDISHSSKATMLQAIAASKAPVLASHSGVRAVCDHTRNLDDETLLALKQNGGVIQCVAFADYVKSSPERAAAVTALRQELGLEGRRNSGEARDGSAPPGDLEQRLQQFKTRMQAIDAKYPRANVHDFADHIDHAVKVIGIDHVGISSDFDGGGGVTGWNDASETANVTIELVRRGYTEAQIDKLWSGNLLRLWRDVEAKARELQGTAKDK
jgi:membrane dipeptidase